VTFTLDGYESIRVTWFQSILLPTLKNYKDHWRVSIGYKSFSLD